MAYYNLDWWGLMKYKIDLAVKQYMEDVTIHPGRQKKNRINRLRYKKLSVSLNWKKLSTVTQDNIYAGLFGPRTLKYWQDKDKMSTDPGEVMWEESRLAQKRMPFVSRRINAKVLSNCCGFSLTLQKRQHQDSSACPLCEQPGEDRDHLLTCTDKRAVKMFEESLKSFGQMVREMGRSSTTTLRQDREQTDKQKMGNGNPTQIGNDTVGLMGIPKWHSTRPDQSIGRRKAYISQLTYWGRFYKRNGRHR
jgi:hypothetical protein